MVDPNEMTRDEIQAEFQAGVPPGRSLIVFGRPIGEATDDQLRRALVSYRDTQRFRQELRQLDSEMRGALSLDR